MSVLEKGTGTDPAVTLRVTGAGQTRRLGRALGRRLRAGDLVLLSGELGAGKTTLTRGIGAGLDVRGPVASPTFVIARVHPSLSGGPALVHVDAYRLDGGLEEMEDLDLDVALPESVVVVEWGEGRVEELSENRLHIVLDRPLGAAENTAEVAEAAEGAAGDTAADEPRTVTLTAVGARWAAEDLTGLLDDPADGDGGDDNGVGDGDVGVGVGVTEEGDGSGGPG